jgi:hypothetical protein
VALDENRVHRGADAILVVEPQYVAELVCDDERHGVAVLSALDSDLRADEASVDALDVRVAGDLVPADADQHPRVAA